jgi:hypothetical protein
MGNANKKILKIIAKFAVLKNKITNRIVKVNVHSSGKYGIDCKLKETTKPKIKLFITLFIEHP